MLNLQNPQLDSSIGNGCESNDAWDYSDGTLTLIFNDVYAADAGLTYSCPTFNLEDVGFDYGVRFKNYSRNAIY